MSEEKKKALSEVHQQHHDINWSMQNWRSWGSWFSWGSPVGLGLFCISLAVTFAIVKWALTL